MTNHPTPTPSGSTRRPHRSAVRRASWIALPALAAATFAVGCGNSDDAADATTTTMEAASKDTTTTVKETEALVVSDAWAKATEEDATGAFGTLVNNSDKDLTIVSATSPAAGTVELHETIENEAGEMVMQPKAGGFVVPAGGEFVLAPGANHIMLMALVAPIPAGEDVQITLVDDKGESHEFAATAKEYSGANERYEGGEDGSGHGG